MATTCPLNFNVGYLRDQVRDTYDQVARDPNRHYHFHRDLFIQSVNFLACKGGAA
jgi:hypothetical protein